MPQFNRATMSMKTLGTLILENDINGKEINDKLASVVAQLNKGELTEENVALFCAYVRKLIQLLEAIKIYVEREQFIDEKALLEWESHLKENKISQFEIGTRNILDSIHNIFLKVSPELREQARDEVRLMKGRRPVHHALASILFNDKAFYLKIASESVDVNLGSRKRHVLRYAAQNALLKLSTNPSKENLEAFRTALMQLLNHLNSHLSRLFNVEEEDEILESHLIKEIDQYIEICRKKWLDNPEKKLIALKKEVIAYFRRDLKDADRMFSLTRRLIRESLKKKEEDEAQLVVEELLTTKSPLFHQAYGLIKKAFEEGIVESKGFLMECLKGKFAGASFPIINHLIILRKGNEVLAILYGQYIVRANVGLIGYFVSKGPKVIGVLTLALLKRMYDQLFLSFKNDARRHGFSSVWLYVGELEEEKGKIKNSNEARIMRIIMKGYGGIPLDFDYYQYPLDAYFTKRTKPVMLILFALSPGSRINGLSREDLRKILIPLLEDVYGEEDPLNFYEMTINSFRNKPFIGIKPGIL